MTHEKSWQPYFLKLCSHGYRTALATGSGFPDTLLIDGEKHFFVELKNLEIGASGDRYIHTVYKPSQPPWHMEYLYKGGKSLYTLFKLNQGYGVVKECKDYVRALASKKLKYSDLPNFQYREYRVLKDLIKHEFS